MPLVKSQNVMVTAALPTVLAPTSKSTRNENTGGEQETKEKAFEFVGV